MTNLTNTAGLSKAAFKRVKLLQKKRSSKLNLFHQRCKTKADEEKCSEAAAGEILKKEYAEALALKVSAPN